MSITLDDVSSLFHIPIDSRFWVAPVLSMSLACLTVARDLGVFEETMYKEFGINRGTHLRMSWLRKTYDELVAAESYEAATRVYMLYLVTCTLFADKLGVYIDA